jgi:hypothetical protein
MQGLRVDIKDPDGAVISTRTLDSQGRFAFTSVVGGEHQMCFAANSTRWFGQPKRFRLDLKLDVGEMGIDYGEVAKKEHLTELEVEVSVSFCLRVVGAARHATELAANPAHCTCASRTDATVE